MKPETGTPASPPVIRSDDLFKGCNEILIQHNGVVYRLRLTANDRLILTK